MGIIIINSWLIESIRCVYSKIHFFYNKLIIFFEVYNISCNYILFTICICNIEAKYIVKSQAFRGLFMFLVLSSAKNLLLG